MLDTAALGERIARLEARIAELNEREDSAAEDRKHKWEVLSALRDEIKVVSGQQALIVERLNSMGQMAKVASDFVAAAREIPTRADYAGLRDDLHELAIEHRELRTEFRSAKKDRDDAVTRMWAFISGAILLGLSGVAGVIATWVGKH